MYEWSTLDGVYRTKCTNNLEFRNAAGKMRLSSSSWGHATAVAIQLKPSHIYGTDKMTKNSFLSRLLFVSYFMKRRKMWAKNIKKEKERERGREIKYELRNNKMQDNRIQQAANKLKSVKFH